MPHINTQLDPIFDAITKKNLEKIKACIEKGSNVNSIDKGSLAATPLIKAIINESNLDIIKCLLEAPNIDVNAKNEGISTYDSYLMTPLRTAIRYIFNFDLRYTVVKLLLEAGAEPNLLSGKDNTSALVEAIKDLYRPLDLDSSTRIAKQKKLICLLLKFGADINYTFPPSSPFTNLLNYADTMNIEIGRFIRYETWKKNEKIKDIRRYSACLSRGWASHQEEAQRTETERLRTLPAEEFTKLANGLNNSIFLLLPKELLLEIAIYASNTYDIFEYKTQSKLVFMFFDRPATIKYSPERFQAEQKEIASVRQKY